MSEHAPIDGIQYLFFSLGAMYTGRQNSLRQTANLPPISTFLDCMMIMLPPSPLDINVVREYCTRLASTLNSHNIDTGGEGVGAMVTQGKNELPLKLTSAIHNCLKSFGAQCPNANLRVASGVT